MPNGGFRLILFIFLLTLQVTDFRLQKKQIYELLHIHHIIPCQNFLKHLGTKVEPRLDTFFVTNTDMHTLHSNIDIIVAGRLEMKNDH